MQDESFFFVKVREVSSKPVLRCSPEDNLVSVAGIMKRGNVSGVVVCAAETPMGMITDRDIRNRLASAPEDIRYFPASSVMSAPLVTVHEDDYVFEAIYRMAKHGIHRLPVVDQAGRLAGMLTNTDVINLQATTPLYFGREIEEAESLDDLRRANDRIVEVVSFGYRAGAQTRDVVSLISRFYDAIAQRVIALLREDERQPLPEHFAYLALGSEGRGEQTLKTDQDSALVYADDCTEAEVAALAQFSERLIEALIRIGVPPCPGGTMANNPLWRRSLSQWSTLIESWISVPTAENQVNFGMFCDLRTVYGDPRLEAGLKDHIRHAVHRNPIFLPYMAKHILRFPPPLGIFGRLKVERSGEHRGKMDIKKAGIFALTEGATLLGLEAGILDGGTIGKLTALVVKEVLSETEGSRMEESFDFLVSVRLKNQMRQVAAGGNPTNFIDPRTMTETERQKLRDALHAVSSFQSSIRDRYKLDFIAR